MSTFVRLSSLSFLFAALLSSITGCSSSDNDADVQRSCFDLGDAVIDAYTRCGAERQETYDAYYAEAGTNCSRVVQIRDEGQLRRSCLPDLRSISCSQLMGGLPYSCHEQLLTQSTDLHGGSLEPSAVAVDGGPFSSLMGSASGELRTEP
ncbi:hypothetical protein LVJ94_43755 [Pendulispora rubella]|uniref:Uncharacterized protein n=1 Tax=Pendulispora rubella TaxID=2741070 RepID=A0ABZ2L2N7_9BACT